MKDLRRKLPPVSALVTFEAAARHANFTRAAAELGVTQAAVSRQIRALEDHLGVKLFRRANRAVMLTPQGRKLERAVAIGLDHIAAIAEDIRRPNSVAQVGITTTIALASVWLMPRIANFRAAHAEIDLKVIASDPILDLAAEGIDVALRYGMGQWPGVEATLLFEIELFPVCSPVFLDRYQHPRSAQDLLQASLLHIDEPNSRDADWAVWLNAVGVKAPPLKGGLRFNNYPLLIQAAVNGQGIALGWGHIIDDLLESGALVRPMNSTLRLEPAFYLVTPADAALRDEVRVFRDWILKETASLR